ncbi:hypothetical protein CC78DRAFT_455352, partial [Lojkania enalia]
RAKASRASKPNSNTPSSAEAPLFPSSKKDKQKIKHSAFIGRIEKSTSKTAKRRRPHKKLVANLESLADALPELDDAQGNTDGGEVEVGQARIRKSLKSRPGAMKRKKKLEKTERDRFSKNLAQMVGSGASNSGGSTSIADRWAALKSHVQGTMEKKTEFVKT